MWFYIQQIMPKKDYGDIEAGLTKYKLCPKKDYSDIVANIPTHRDLFKNVVL